MKKVQSYLIASLLLVTLNYRLSAQSPAPENDIVKLIRDMKDDKCSFLEVSQEMFELLASDERAQDRIKEYFSKMRHLLYLQCYASRDKNTQPDLAKDFERMATDNHFKLLMRSESGPHKSLFYKRKNGDLNEYLLATKTRIQYISTSMDIKSIQEMTQIIEVTGEAGGL